MGATASLAVSSPLDFSAVDDDAAAEAMLQVGMLLPAAERATSKDDQAQQRCKEGWGA